ncbi:DUF4153 domain-containing protein [Pelotomaculum propionicicum]|uniref:Uncharacterized protein n=1 Tax=Pelotomaculum propionicicum TaxID=258475 RepID=A0A4Y7RLY8_9FIRM|nr:DUF4173 domain-containing protein [Pelotomaculum propionicicum]TEB09836.1 hypothetical protein Pmgp_02837 [Pelotomaculum propionicicum]
MEVKGSQVKEKLLLILFALAAGFIFDYLFYGKELGISYPIYVLVLLSLFWWSQRQFISVEKSFGWFVLIPVLLLAATFAIYANPVLLAINFLLIPVLLVVHTISAANSRVSWSDLSIIGQIVKRVIPLTIENIPKPFLFIVEQLTPKESGSGFLTVKKIVTGLLICVPVLFVVLPLLSSADMVFNHYLSHVARFWELVELGPAARQGLIILFVFVCLSGYIWSFHSKPPKVETEKPTKHGSLDPVTLLTVLFVINLVYLLFSIIQFSYLYGVQGHLLPAGFTYAEYARRGFFELVAVTIINLGILLGSFHYVDKKNQRVNTIVRYCLSLLVLFSLNMLFSAHFKMSLYEEACGLTYLRVFVHYFMLLLLTLILLALGHVWHNKIPLAKAYIVIALAFYTVLNFINIDKIIVRSSIDRYVKTGEIDINYLKTLSCDAIPDLLTLTQDADQETVQQIKAYLLKEKQYLAEDKPWQSFNYSRYKANSALKNVGGENR